MRPRYAAGPATPATDPPVRPVGRVGRLLTTAIVAYRRWISPALPARCRFHPSCSAYALQAVTAHGALRGSGLAIWRLLRCQPFNPGGYDPVPPVRRRADVTGA